MSEAGEQLGTLLVLCFFSDSDSIWFMLGKDPAGLLQKKFTVTSDISCLFTFNPPRHLSLLSKPYMRPWVHHVVALCACHSPPADSSAI